MMRKSLITLSFVTILTLGGCSLSPELKTPTLEMPLEATSPVSVEDVWWKGYGDTTLNALIEEALSNNYDLQSAMVNIAQARATMSSNTSNRYPSVDVEGSSKRTRTSADSFNSTQHKTYNDFSLSAVLSYEVDLWGKYKEAEASSRASLIATYAAKDTVKLSLCASVVDSYMGLLGLHEQLDIVKSTIASREESLKRYQAQYSLGSINRLTLLQEEAELNSAKNTQESLLQSIALQQSALAILVGKSPKEIEAFSHQKQAHTLPREIDVPSSLPSELLSKRPDIKQAEENLKAANANIGVARAAYFPSISLSGAFGYESTQLSNLVGTKSAMQSLGGSFASPLFNMGKTSATVDSAKASKELAEIAYKQSVQQAFKEVYDALNTRHSLKQRLNLQEAYVANMEKIYVLSEKQYKEGYGDYLSLLDAKRNYLNAQLVMVQLKQSLLSSGVSLFKALGGGWNSQTFESQFSSL